MRFSKRLRHLLKRVRPRKGSFPVEVEELDERVAPSASMPLPYWPEARPRQLYAEADVIHETAAPVLLHSAEVMALQAAAQRSNEVIFIDSTVPGHEELLAGLERPAAVYLLRPDADGVQQMAEALAGLRGVQAVHLVAHGAPGEIKLGATTLSLENLDKYMTELGQIEDALSEDADLLLYGCDVAAGLSGEVFVGRLGALTGTDVAASTGPVGAVTLGGDWRLERATGPIETAIAFRTDTLSAYQALLAITAIDDFYSTPMNTPLVNMDVLGNDSGPGTLQIQSYTLPANGTLVLNLDQTFTFTPAVNFVGSTSFTYSLSVQDFKIWANDYVKADAFAQSVAIDGQWAVLGTPLSNLPGKDDAGAVYVFRQGPTGWTQFAKLNASDAGKNDFFGSAVSINGNLIAVGAPGYDAAGGKNGAGAVYLFAFNPVTNQWTEISKLVNPWVGDPIHNAKDNKFGSAVDLEMGTATNGNRLVLVVGAPYAEVASMNGGFAWVYIQDGGGNWFPKLGLAEPDGVPEDHFGAAVAVSGDTIAIGARDNNAAGSDSGAVYLFRHTGDWEWGTWSFSKKIIGSDTAAGDFFGYALDLDGDTLAVGAPRGNMVGNNTGATYLYYRNQGGDYNWGQVQRIVPANGAQLDHFGESISLAGDTLAVGATYVDLETPGTIDVGAAYVFGRNQGGADNWGQLEKFIAPDAAKNDHLGMVATDGQTLLVGAAEGDLGPTNDPGVAYLHNVKTATATVYIDVTQINQAPVAFDGSATTKHDTPVVITLTGSDPDGDSIIFELVSFPTHGSLSGSGSLYTFTPALNYAGPDSFTFRTYDGKLYSASATISISVTNAAPAANDQTVTTNHNVAVATTLTGSDTDGDALTYAVVTSPANGTLSGTGANRTYTPNFNFTGTDSFTFRTNDGIANSALATVTINVLNVAPVANNQTVSTGHNTPVAITLTGSDTDGDSLTYVVVSGPSQGSLSGAAPNLTYTPPLNFIGTITFTFKVNDFMADSPSAVVTINVTDVSPVANNQSVTARHDIAVPITLTGYDVDGDPLTYVVVSGPTQGSLSGTAPNLTYTPALHFVGLDTFTFKVNDGMTDSAVATVTINITNQAPVANGQTLTTSHTTPLPIVLTGFDQDGDPLVFTVVSGPSNGTLSGTGANRTYTPNPNYAGPDSFTFKVNDGIVDSPVATVTISVTNVLPIANPQTLSTKHDTPVNITLTGLDSDNDPLAFLLVSGPSNGTLSGTGANRTYTPAPGFTGTDTFTFKVNDGIGNSLDAVVTIQVTNTVPVAHDQSLGMDESTSAVLTLTGSDADGDALTFMVLLGPGHGTLSGSGPTLTYTPNSGYFGLDSFTFRANDGIADSAPATVSMTIREIGLPATLPVSAAPYAAAAGLPAPPPAAGVGPGTVPTTGAPQFFDIRAFRPPETVTQPPPIIPAVATDVRDTITVARIEGLLYLDLDRNGLLGEEEEGIPGILVMLEPAEGFGELARTFTGPEGRFMFASVRPGVYRLRFVLPARMAFRQGGDTESVTVAQDASVVYVEAGAQIQAEE